MIGGFELPSSGEIFIEEAIGDRPPYRRPVNTVFQNYALFPHMSVAQNVSYGLEMAGVAKPERQRRVQDALAMVRLPHVEGASRRSSPVDSSSVWRWLARSSTVPRCSSWMNRSARST